MYVFFFSSNSMLFIILDKKQDACTANTQGIYTAIESGSGTYRLGSLMVIVVMGWNFEIKQMMAWLVMNINVI